jgi:hypothetical protein
MVADPGWRKMEKCHMYVHAITYEFIIAYIYMQLHMLNVLHVNT